MRESLVIPLANVDRKHRDGNYLLHKEPLENVWSEVVLYFLL